MACAGGGCGDEQYSLNSKNGCSTEHPVWLPSMEHIGLHSTWGAEVRSPVRYDWRWLMMSRCHANPRQQRTCFS